MTAPTIDVVIPTARWSDRPQSLIFDLQRHLSPFGDRIGEIFVADADSVHFLRDSLFSEGQVTSKDAKSNLNGPAINRNKALRYSRADWVVFLDDDVRLVNQWGERLWTVLQDPSTPDLVGGSILAERQSNWFSQAAEDFVIRHKRQPDGWYLAAAHLLVRRTALDELEGFDDSFIYGGEDWDLCKRAHMHGLTVGIETSLQVVHEHPTTWQQLMRKADQYGVAETGLDVYSEPAPQVDESLTGNSAGSLATGVRLAGRVASWPLRTYREFRGIGRNRVRSVRSTALYAPWMFRYLKSRRQA